MAVAALPAHDNIVGQYRAWQQGGHFNIQMELCEGGSLAQLLCEVLKAGSDCCMQHNMERGAVLSTLRLQSVAKQLYANLAKSFPSNVSVQA